MRKPKLKYNCKWIAKGYVAITLYPYICFKESEEVIAIDGETLMKHEMCHWNEIHAEGRIKWYSIYLWEYLKGLIKYRNMNDAYWNISAEKRARDAESA